MCRIHRFGQKHDPVVIVNLIANNTREGLVIGTLLRKLEAIRRELKSDKVFDVVGRIFENVSITSYLADALVDDNAADVAKRLEGRLTREQVDAISERDRTLFGDGGAMEAIAWLRETVGDIDLASWLRARDGHGLDARQLRFWQTVLKVPSEVADRWVERVRSSPWGMRHNAAGGSDDSRSCNRTARR